MLPAWPRLATYVGSVAYYVTSTSARRPYTSASFLSYEGCVYLFTAMFLRDLCGRLSKILPSVSRL